MRYYHLLQPLARSQWPARILIVAHDVFCTAAGRDNSTTHTALGAWSLRAFVRNGDSYVSVNRIDGNGSADFWEAISDYSSRNRTSLIIGYDVGTLWNVAGLWEQIESGCIELYQGRDNKGQSHDKRNEGGTPGYLVIEDPPCIAVLGYARSKVKMSWMDIRNFGIQKPEQFQSAISIANWLSGVVGRLSKWFHDYNIGSFQSTIGAQAAHCFRLSHLKDNMYVHCNKYALAIESASYYGGRCEVQKIGACGERVWLLDRRSSYGAVMLREAVPTMLARVIYPIPIDYAIEPAEGIGHIAQVEICTEEPDYPFRRGEDVIYPIGSFVTTLAGPELYDAISLGRVVRVIRVAEYATSHALSNYVNSIYDMRQNAEHKGDKEAATIAKGLLVNLSGKFGQLNRKWVTVPNHIADVQYGSWYAIGRDGNSVRYRAIAGIVQRDEICGPADNAIPAIASWITSRGRMELLDMIRLADRRNVKYYDTDSILVNAAGLELIETAGRLGGDTIGSWTIRAVADDGQCMGIKWYRLNGLTRCAGMAPTLDEKQTDGATVTRPLKTVEQLRAGVRPTGRLVTVPAGRSDQYKHGIVLEDGSVLPIRMNDCLGEPLW